MQELDPVSYIIKSNNKVLFRRYIIILIIEKDILCLRKGLAVTLPVYNKHQQRCWWDHKHMYKKCTWFFLGFSLGSVAVSNIKNIVIVGAV